MREIFGDMWSTSIGSICITTNGVVNQRGEAVMGRGCALQAKQRFPDLPLLLGKVLRDKGNHVHYLGLWSGLHLYSFPTKNHWRDASSVALIR